ncbi:transposase [Vibrio navarrensis]|uniref:Transposase n=1 Tax=Vibrio navarrensis TaxID=29495 RepID=A0AAI9CY38_9VIBR|nr:transposase [Vibrio navarrensis]EKA5637871.1 transposase [Vibrio navarrensis]ELN6934336.1 transposase [Vibrio navarrensis]
MSLKVIDVWFQDKARFTQQNQRLVYRLTRHKAESRKAAAIRVHLLFDSVCPARGIGETIVVPWVNKDIMIEHLKQILAITEKERHAVIIMDGASWHTNDIAEPFSNVSIIKLPTYSPRAKPDRTSVELAQTTLSCQSEFLPIMRISWRKCTRLGIDSWTVQIGLAKCAQETGLI